VLDQEVAASERLSRFIFQKTYYRSSDLSVRHNAFMPNRNGETSVYRTSELEDDTIYNIGKNFVADIINKPLLGRADIIATNVFQKNLQVLSIPQPHPRHANITSWPEDKSERKLIAVELASEAHLNLL